MYVTSKCSECHGLSYIHSSFTSSVAAMAAIRARARSRSEGAKSQSSATSGGTASNNLVGAAARRSSVASESGVSPSASPVSPTFSVDPTISLSPVCPAARGVDVSESVFGDFIPCSLCVKCPQCVDGKVVHLDVTKEQLAKAIIDSRYPAAAAATLSRTPETNSTKANHSSAKEVTSSKATESSPIVITQHLQNQNQQQTSLNFDTNSPTPTSATSSPRKTNLSPQYASSISPLSPDSLVSPVSSSFSSLLSSEDGKKAAGKAARKKRPESVAGTIGLGMHFIGSNTAGGSAGVQTLGGGTLWSTSPTKVDTNPVAFASPAIVAATALSRIRTASTESTPLSLTTPSSRHQQQYQQQQQRNTEDLFQDNHVHQSDAAGFNENSESITVGATAATSSTAVSAARRAAAVRKRISMMSEGVEIEGVTLKAPPPPSILTNIGNSSSGSSSGGGAVAGVGITGSVNNVAAVVEGSGSAVSPRTSPFKSNSPTRVSMSPSSPLSPLSPLSASTAIGSRDDIASASISSRKMSAKEKFLSGSLSRLNPTVAAKWKRSGDGLAGSISDGMNLGGNTACAEPPPAISTSLSSGSSAVVSNIGDSVSPLSSDKSPSSSGSNEFVSHLANSESIENRKMRKVSLSVDGLSSVDQGGKKVSPKGAWSTSDSSKFTTIDGGDEKSFPNIVNLPCLFSTKENSHATIDTMLWAARYYEYASHIWRQQGFPQKPLQEHIANDEIKYRILENFDDGPLSTVKYLSKDDGSKIIVSGTAETLVDSLIFPLDQDESHSTVFLATYRFFMPSSALLTSLIEWYNVEVDEDATPHQEAFLKKHRRAFRSRSVQVLLLWIKNHWHDFHCNPTLFEELSNFVADVSQISFGDGQRMTQAIREQRLSWYMAQYIPPFSSKRAALSETVKPWALRWEAEPFAEQLTLIDSMFFRQIRPDTYLHILQNPIPKSEMQDSVALKVIMDYLSWFRLVSSYTATLIVKEESKKRSKAIKKFIKIAKICRDLNNFNTCFAIMSGLKRPAVARQPHVWDGVSSKYMDSFREMEELMNPTDGYNAFWSALKVAKTPLIPFFGAYMHDLVEIHEEDPIFVSDLQLNMNGIDSNTTKTREDSFERQNQEQEPGYRWASADGDDGTSPDYPNHNDDSKHTINFLKFHEIHAVILELEVWRGLCSYREVIPLASASAADSKVDTAAVVLNHMRDYSLVDDQTLDGDGYGIGFEAVSSFGLEHHDHGKGIGSRSMKRLSQFLGGS